MLDSFAMNAKKKTSKKAPTAKKKTTKKASRRKPPAKPVADRNMAGEQCLLWRRVPCYTNPAEDVMGDLYFREVPGGYLIRGFKGAASFLPDPSHVVFKAFVDNPADLD